MNYPDAEAEIFDDQSSDDQSFEDQSFEDQSFEDQSMENQSLEGRGAENHDVENQGLKNNSIEDQGAENKSLTDQSVEGQSAKNQSLADGFSTTLVGKTTGFHYNPFQIRYIYSIWGFECEANESIDYQETALPVLGNSQSTEQDHKVERHKTQDDAKFGLDIGAALVYYTATVAHAKLTSRHCEIHRMSVVGRVALKEKELRRRALIRRGIRHSLSNSASASGSQIRNTPDSNGEREEIQSLREDYDSEGDYTSEEEALDEDYSECCLTSFVSSMALVLDGVMATNEEHDGAAAANPSSADSSPSSTTTAILRPSAAFATQMADALVRLPTAPIPLAPSPPPGILLLPPDSDINARDFPFEKHLQTFRKRAAGCFFTMLDIAAFDLPMVIAPGLDLESEHMRPLWDKCMEWKHEWEENFARPPEWMVDLLITQGKSVEEAFSRANVKRLLGSLAKDIDLDKMMSDETVWHPWGYLVCRLWECACWGATTFRGRDIASGLPRQPLRADPAVDNALAEAIAASRARHSSAAGTGHPLLGDGPWTGSRARSISTRVPAHPLAANRVVRNHQDNRVRCSNAMRTVLNNSVGPRTSSPPRSTLHPYLINDTNRATTADPPVAEAGNSSSSNSSAQNPGSRATSRPQPPRRRIPDYHGPDDQFGRGPTYRDSGVPISLLAAIAEERRVSQVRARWVRVQVDAPDGVPAPWHVPLLSNDGRTLKMAKGMWWLKDMTQ